MGHEHSTQLHIFVVSHHICWTNVLWTILRYFGRPILETSRGFTIQSPSSQTSRSPISSSLPVSPLFLSTTSFQAGWLSAERPQTGPKYVQWFNESAQKLKSHICNLSEIMSKRIVFVVFPGCSMTFSRLGLLILDLLKFTPWVSGAVVCMAGTLWSLTSAELDPNEAAQQLWRSNRTWWAGTFCSSTFMYFPTFCRSRIPPRNSRVYAQNWWTWKL